MAVHVRSTYSLPPDSAAGVGVAAGGATGGVAGVGPELVVLADDAGVLDELESDVVDVEAWVPDPAPDAGLGPVDEAPVDRVVPPASGIAMVR
ncbi:MAG: hypothetical protein QM572_12150 [Nocardioides sp.]|uniref:hypothetical protein n=1 Tax=Nocardioides sp. TaxID=35761 RepID=UPI0039E56924